MITLKKIAKLANVSISTVSRALNDAYDISPETREKILQIAKQNGYFQEKKRIRSENRQKNRFQIAILCPEIDSDFYSVVVAELMREFHRQHCNCIIYNSNFDNVVMTDLLEQCVDDPQIDAIISLGHVTRLPKQLDIPLVLPDTHHGNVSSLHHRNTEAFAAILLAIEESGITRVAFAGEPLTASKADAFCYYAAEHGITAEAFCSRSRFDKSGKEAAEHFMAKGTLPELIVCAYDEIACGLIEGLRSAGIKVPEQVGVIGWNDIPTARYCFGGLSTIQYETDVVIPKLVADIIQDKKQGIVSKKKYTIPAKLIRRKTF